MYVKRSHLLVVILLTGSAVLGATLTTRENSGKVEAQTANDGTRWEHCVVTKASYGPTNNRSGQYWIIYFKNSEFKVENVEGDFTTNAALARAIAKLGDEGWEMVGVGPMEVRNAKLDGHYFKRAKRGNP